MSTPDKDRIQVTFTAEEFLALECALTEQITETSQGLAYNTGEEEALRDQRKIKRLVRMLVHLGLNSREVSSCEL